MSYLVIGGGSIGQRHHANLQALGAESQLRGWRQLDLGALDLNGVTGLVIATATQIRLPLIRAAAEAGVPVYVEKPLAYRASELTAIHEVAAPIAERSVLGLMMRYHPAVRHLTDLAPDIYGFHLEIGHDVRQWRQNWRFAHSYAAKADGGGVLLDLCHEIDIAACLLPGLAVTGVDCLGHVDFPGVDFASRIAMAGQGATGTVAMDYLSPVSIRRLSLRGREEAIELDFLVPKLSRWRDGAEEVKTWSFDRNDMFLDLMRDFIALAEGRAPSDNPLLPRLDRVEKSTALTAAAWEARAFRGTLTGGFA